MDLLRLSGFNFDIDHGRRTIDHAPWSVVCGRSKQNQLKGSNCSLIRINCQQNMKRIVLFRV